MEPDLEIFLDEALAEKTALEYVETWKDVRDPKVESTKICYIWGTEDRPAGAFFIRHSKCLLVKGTFDWARDGDGSFKVLIDESGIRGCTSSAGKVPQFL